MKTRITLISMMCMLFIFSVSAEKRIYFTYGNTTEVALPVEDGLETVDYRCGNGFKVNNYNNFSGPWNPTSGGFILDGAYGYRQYGFKIATAETFSCVHQLESSTEEVTADLSEITADWTFHIAIKTTYEGALLFGLHDNTGTSYQIDITDDVFTRDGSTWNEIEIDMGDYIEDTEIDVSKCTFVSVAADPDVTNFRDMWSIFGENVSEDGNFAWDDCYLTDNGKGGNDGISKNSVNEEKLVVVGNSIKISGNVTGFSIYSIAGTLVATVANNETELELASGIYIVKTEKNAFKFVR